MTNVINSTSTAADNCVELPAHLKAKKLVVFYLFFRQWTGTVSMSRSDYSAGTDGSLPPDEVTANYGMKRVIDPKHLRIFDTLKKRAETILADAGLPFCKGVAVPVEKAPEVIKSLRELAEEFNKQRDRFCADLSRFCAEWKAQNPEFAARISLPQTYDVAGRINADFAVFQFQPAGQELDTTDSVGRTVNGLFAEVIRDVSRRSRVLLIRSVSGKEAKDMSQRTLSALRLLREKLASLQFLNSGVRPLLTLFERLLGLMPTKGKFTSDQYNALNGALGLLSDENLLSEVAASRLTLDQYMERSFPSVPMPAVTASLFTEASTAEVKEAVAEAQAAEETAEAVPAAEVKTAEVKTEAAGKDDADGTAGDKQNEPEPETKVATQAAQDMDALLNEFFGVDSVPEVAEVKPEAKTEEKPEGPAEAKTEAPESETEESLMLLLNVPPAPKAIHLSAF